MQQIIDVQTPVVREKRLKRNILKEIDVGIEDSQFEKREKVQREEEAEAQIKLMERPSNQLGFQMQLGKPKHSTSSYVSTDFELFLIEETPSNIELL